MGASMRRPSIIRRSCARLQELHLLLPGLDGRMHRMDTGLLADLVINSSGVARLLLALRAELPTADVSALVDRRGLPIRSLWACGWQKKKRSVHASRWPGVLRLDVGHVTAQVQRLRERLPPEADLGDLLTREPMLLRADIDRVLSEARRLVPGEDPALLLLRNPGMLLDMETGGLGSSLGVPE